MPEILADPHMAARGMVGTFDDPDRGATPGLRTPARLSGYDEQRFEPPPRLGADTRAILADELGLDLERIDALYEKGIVA